MLGAQSVDFAALAFAYIVGHCCFRFRGVTIGDRQYAAGVHAWSLLRVLRSDCDFVWLSYQYFTTQSNHILSIIVYPNPVIRYNTVDTHFSPWQVKSLEILAIIRRKIRFWR